MGVPKFYRWLSERYPCLSEVVQEYQIPEFDNLYLDMNGIIHLCSHPNDDDPTFRITEEKIFVDISNYIESLLRLIKPKKVFFMAVDGVAPRAKMNQQRGRRFRSAREAIESEEKAVRRGEVLPKEERFDSNCITPGTEFMAKLDKHLQYLVTKKISTDPSWKGIRVYLSGHSTPGEGEHKIMDFIRHEKSQPGYDSNTRHCLYGLDADLIMLGMCSHDPHFSLLREEVRFSGRKQQKRVPTVENTTFHLLHLSLLRDYLDHEFSVLKTKLNFSYDIEKVIDDWILLGFLVGNDFIPNLPHLHIASGALSTLYRTYIQVLPTLDGYLNENGYLNLSRFEKYMANLAQVDYEHFDEFFTDFKCLETRKPNDSEARGTWKSKRIETRKQLDQLRRATENLLIDCEDEIEEEDDEEDDEDEYDDGFDLMSMEFEQNKRDYYMNKLQLSGCGAEAMAEQAECYARAIQWTLHYYYNGVCSWSWFYPHHYAPFISDIKNFSHLKLKFELGEAFLPFQQLLAVLPAASKQLLPKPYQSLMCDGDSPLIDYYPIDFLTDLNGKQNDWEAVVLLPFIDQKRLVEAMDPLSSQLSADESHRNRHGPCLLYTTSPTPLPPFSSYWPQVLPPIQINYAKCVEIPIDGFRVEPHALVRGLGPGVNLQQCYLGFPNLRFIPHKASLKKAEVKVFQQISKGENMILHIEKHRLSELKGEEAMELLVNSTIYVGWPHLVEAKVNYVADEKYKYVRNSSGQIERVEMNKNQNNIWRMESVGVKEKYMKRWGINIGEVQLLIYANQLVGFKRVLSKTNGNVVDEKVYSPRYAAYCIQVIVTNDDVEVVSSSWQCGSLKAENLFPINSTCFLLANGDQYGLQATIKRLIDSPKKGLTVEVSLTDSTLEPDLQPIINEYQNCLDDFVGGRIACNRLGISPYMLSRITSTLHILVSDYQKINIGLNMKSSKRSEEMPGYTRKSNDGWKYSSLAIQAVDLYLQNYPELFDFLNGHPSTSEMLQHEDLLINCPKVKLSEVESFLKSLPSYSMPCYPCGSEFLPQQLSDRLEEQLRSSRDSSAEASSSLSKTLNVWPHQLFVPSNVVCVSAELPPDPTKTTVRLLDRVINVKPDNRVPLGLKGTVIGIIGTDQPIYEVLFDAEFEGALSVRGFASRVYRLRSAHMLNLSGGKNRKHEQSNEAKPTAVVHPHLATRGGGVNRRQQMTTSNQKATVVVNRSGGLNHSPNSPFAPMKPQYYSQAASSSNNSDNSKDSEFRALWKNLQTKNTTRKNHSSSFNTAQSTMTSDASPALLLAAKSLPKVHEPQQEQSNAKQEFSNLLQALEKQLAPAMPTSAVITTPKPVYAGQSISLDELFSSPTTTKPPEHQPVPHLPRSNVMNLMALSQQLLRAVPIYLYQVTPDGLYLAQVTLSNGVVAQSPPCKTQQEAAELAAFQAYNQLTVLSGGVRRDNKIEVRPPLLIPPFVQPYMVGALKGPVLYQAPPANRAPPPPPINQHMQWFLSRPPMPAKQTNIQNQFVPLQVTKQSNIGHKTTKVPPESGNAVQSKEDKSSKATTSSGTQQPNKVASSATQSMSATSAEDKTPKKRPPKTKKSKLAINFSAAKF
ncbi:5'-3' exoribonuclease 1 [Chamberlinius hualienensis]